MAARDALWRLLPDVRVQERSRFLFFGGLVALLSFAQTLGLAASEALFVARLGAGALAGAFVAASLVTVLGSLLYAVRVGAVRNDILFVRWLGGAAITLAVATGAAGREVELVYPAMFCLWYVLQAVLINHFWTFASDYFDTLASKRLFPLFTAGTSVGGAAGGLAAMLLATTTGPVALVAGWSFSLASAALFVGLARRRLRRWGLSSEDEADESSMEGLRGAVRYLGRSALARGLVVSVLGMVLALFLAQYLYLEVFAASFPDPTELATFLAAYLALSNFVELVVELWITPALIRRVGVPGANMLHPLLMLLSFGGLALRWDLIAAVGLRAARELAENAIAMPVRSLIFNAMPARFRGRMRALLEGIVFYAGMSLAGVVLLAFPDAEPQWFCGAGAVAALAYFLANARTRREYLATLVEQLRAGRLDLATVGQGLGAWEASRLAALWEPLVRGGDEGASPGLLELAPHLAARGILDPLIRAASHPNADVRRASISALATTGAAGGPLALALDDPDAAVRLAALRGLAGPGADPGFLAARARDLLADPDPAVRAEAALHFGDEGAGVLRSMLASEHDPEALAALAVAPAALASDVAGRVRAGSPEVRAGALECLVRLKTPSGGRSRPGAGDTLASSELALALADPHSAVRRAGLRLLAARREPDAVSRLARALDDPSAEVRAAAESALAARGANGVAAAEPYLRSEREQTTLAALRVFARSQLRDSRSVLAFELRRLSRELWYLTIATERLPAATHPRARLLRIAFADAVLRAHRLAFAVLALIEQPAVVRKVERGLSDPRLRTRADALELLSNLGDRDAAGLLVLLHEAAPLAERERVVAGLVAVPSDPAEIVMAARSSPLRWVRASARALAPQEGDPPQEETTMERLLALRQVDLLAQLSLEQLEAVAQLTEEGEYLAGEQIVREGEAGDRLYLLLEGSVRVVKGYGTPQALELRTLQAVDYFGEMAVLADEPRSATIVAASPARLLSLDGESLRELIREHPDISFSIFRVLTGRLRAAETRLADRAETAGA
jgi:HEAT repeat protein